MPLTYQQLQRYLEVYPDEIEVVQAFEALGSMKSMPKNTSIFGSAWIIRPSDHTVLMHDQQYHSWPLPQGELPTLYNTPETIKQVATQTTQLQSELVSVHNQIFNLDIQYQPTCEDIKHHYVFNICMLFYTKEPCAIHNPKFSWHNTADLLHSKPAQHKLTRLAKKWQWMSYQILETV